MGGRRSRQGCVDSEPAAQGAASATFSWPYRVIGAAEPAPFIATLQAGRHEHETPSPLGPLCGLGVAPTAAMRAQRGPMTRLKTHIEHHRGSNAGWLRAAVLGANDGLLSTASLVLGVASAAATHQAVLIAAAAGLVAGAMSMAAGEYVSVSSQSDAEEADLKRESQELRDSPASEHTELKSLYMARGLDADTAAKVADQLMAKDALGAHARDELGYSSTNKARPIQAAFASAGAFAAGAVAPIVVVAVTPHALLTPVLWLTALSVLLVLGLLASRVAGANPWRAAVRVVFWGALAMGVTAGIGRLVGHAI